MNRKDFIRNTLIAIAASLLPKTLQPQEIELSNRPQASDYNIFVRKEVNGVEITCVDNLFFSVDPKHY